MSLNAEQLFALLPAVYRNRDDDIGDPLRSLYVVLAQQLGVIEDNIQQLYDDQFIETCAPWVIPYIGDLIGYNSIYGVAGASFDSRAEVANTIGYRRRKGTLIALEQVSADVSGRTTVAVEEFRRLITTESMRLVRPRHASTVNLRHTSALDRFGTAFDTQSRTVDVRRIAPRLRLTPDPDPAPLEIGLHGPGRFNIPDIAIHLWRLKSCPVVNAPAFSLGNGRYMFSPLGANMPLFSQPPARASFSDLITRINVPEPIDRVEFARSLHSAAAPAFYGPSASILLIADGVPVPASQIVCANLSDFAGGGWCTVPAGKIALDPELGRIAFAADLPILRSLRLNFSFGSAAELGGGPYDRSVSLTGLKPAQASLFIIIGSATPTLESAIAQWNALVASTPASTGIIVLPDFERVQFDLTGPAAIQLPPGSNLTLVSGQPIPSGGPFDVVWNHSCATLHGDLEVIASTAPAESAAGGVATGQLLLSGLWIAGQLSITGGAATIQVADCTLVPGLALTRGGDPVWPGDPSIQVTAEEVSLSVLRSITGPIAADAGGSTRVCSSILDATSPCCVGYAASDLASAGGDLHIEDSTVIGKVHTRTIPLASNTIFYARRPRRDPWPAAVWASRRQTGCVRFCSLPFDSITPRRYLCLPPDAASEAALVPRFITLRFGEPAYALLSGDVPLAVWHGADNGSQMGVYYAIQETEAVRNVQVRAPEYLPVALESGIFLHPSRPLPKQAQLPRIAYGGPVPPRQCCDDADSDIPSFAGIGGSLV
jgi:hypothetical protein